MKNEERAIIGETDQAGLPISAPVKPAELVETGVRWRKKAGGSFVLEFWHEVRDEWIEVPLVRAILLLLALTLSLNEMAEGQAATNLTTFQVNVDTNLVAEQSITVSNFTRKVMASGLVCQLSRHNWRAGRPGEEGGRFLDYHPGVEYRTCWTCGKVETRIDEWNEEQRRFSGLGMVPWATNGIMMTNIFITNGFQVEMYTIPIQVSTNLPAKGPQ